MSKSKLDQKFWAKYFKVYDVLNMVIPYQELLDTIVKELDVKRGDLVLDAGCGTGNLAVKLSEKGANVVGIDYSKEALSIMKGKNIKNVQIRQHDLTKPLPFPDNYFDKIASNNVIYTLPEEVRPQVFSEFYRVLKKGGVIVVSNVHEGFKPIEIYKDHLKKEIKKAGALRLFVKVLKMLIPTFKMFYYNAKIKKEHKGGDFRFLKNKEQSLLLSRSGFKKNYKELLSYSNQSLLVGAKK